jgi:hypothetical protein
MKIYTHGQQAHMDELMGCAILIYKLNPERISIARKFNSGEVPTELGEDDYVIDICGKYDGKQWFDHHMPEMKGQCSASLIARDLAPELLKDARLGRFIKRIADQDNNGKQNMKYSYPEDRFMFIEEGLIEIFEKDAVTASKVVAAMIASRMKTVELNGTAKEWLEKNSHVEEYSNAFKALIIEKDPRFDGVNQRALNRVVAGWQQKNTDVEVCVNWGDRCVAGDERVIYITPSGLKRGLNLNNIKGMFKHKFLHSSGFMATYTVKDHPDHTKILDILKMIK